MTVRVDWDDPDHSILLYSLGRNWTWDELFEAADKGIAMTDTVSHNFCVIVDYQSGQGLPPGAITHFSRIARLMNTQTEMVIVAGGGTWLLSLFNLFVLITGNNASKYAWVSDLDKAYSTVAARRSASITEA
ncbi:MAG: hypothetical protein GC179_27695 [Anaerolineaceae bacterium]|nr:hypothetical protein [Anaerolineaceae bacterium]